MSTPVRGWLVGKPAGSAGAAADALAGEHAAIYAYGVVGGRLPRREQPLAAAAITRHRRSRDALTAALSAGPSGPSASGMPSGPPADAGELVPPAAAYALPFPVRSRADALRLAALVEDRLAALYLAVVASPGGEPLRGLAVAELQSTAVASSTWRLLAGALPVTVAFPGREVHPRASRPATRRSPGGGPTTG